MTHDPMDLPDDEVAPREGASLPVPDQAGRNAPVARQPMEQVARAMVVQAELMKQMHERQRLLEDVVKDNRRHELVINSAQALNESFQGLQRVQERLADKLDDSGGVNRSRFLVIALALLALAAVGGILTWRLTEKADEFNSTLKVALDPKQRDQQLQTEMQSGLTKLESRLQAVEEADRAAFRDEIDRLRKGYEMLGAERDTLRRERDGAREELGAAKAALSGAQSDAADAKGKLSGLERDNARLVAEGVANQKTVLQLNDVIATIKGGKIATGSQAQPSDDEIAQKPAPSPKDGAPPPVPSPAQPPAVEKPLADERANLSSGAGVGAGVPAAPPSATEPANAGTESLVAFPESQLQPINDLLKLHNGSDRYEVRKADKAGKGRLWNVLMEVRGPDGTLQKTIEAESFSVWTGDKKSIDLEFEGGSVTFHQGSTKAVKSPFYNNKYKIVVLGANVKAWLAPGFPFVRAR